MIPMYHPSLLIIIPSFIIKYSLSIICLLSGLQRQRPTLISYLVKLKVVVGLKSEHLTRPTAELSLPTLYSPLHSNQRCCTVEPSLG